jgi:AcrR family transcriptional regulator
MPKNAASQPAARTRGRPRSQQAHNAVLDAARALVEKGGYAAATIDEISARSGVAKTTIYRRWSNRPALLVDLLLKLAEEVAPPPSGRDPLRALRTELSMVAEASDALPGRLLGALLGEIQRDQDVRDALVNGLFKPRRRATANVIHEAQLAGTLRKDVPPLFAVDLLFGPLFYRKYIRQEQVTAGFVKELFEFFLAGMQSGGVVRHARKTTRRRKPGH